MAKRAQQVGASEFEEFWASYPRKVGKLAAQREYERARTRASAEAILAGLQRTRFADELRFVPHPRTWLSQGRWLDEEIAPRRVQGQAEDWYAECQRIHGGACGLSRMAHHTRKQLEAGS